MVFGSDEALKNHLATAHGVGVVAKAPKTKAPKDKTLKNKEEK